MGHDFPVDTAALLTRVQRAFARAAQTNDTQLFNAAQSVMSALIVVMRHQRAMLRAEMQPFIDKLGD